MPQHSETEAIRDTDSMTYVPPDRNWYIAEIIMQIEIEGDADTLVHVETKLVYANSPDEAFEKAIQFGRAGEIQYENTDHNQVRLKFRGLRDLFLICDELKDGAEILYEERSGLSETQIAALVKPKSELAVFRADA